ncbi:MAG: ribosome biogenesis GTPase Der [Chloroflexota bacterium]|nr:MAG: ribosome biogenesis GTPase Der [Chloroflexota bacterium]
MARRPMVALVGRPNVGKSTLFNRLVGERMAVIDDIPGTTRDRIQAEAEWLTNVFVVVDTGGIEVYQPKGARDESPLAEGSADFIPQIRAQALLAVEEADVVIMVVDAVTGVTSADEEVAEILRRGSKPVIVAANKADNMDRFNDVVEFYALGLGEVFPISAIHGLGIGDMLDAVVAELRKLPVSMEEEDESDHLRVAIVGRPNVGKSSLLNKLLGEERVIVSPVAGTTRDAIDEQVIWHGKPVTLIDTAGIRKRGKIEAGVEKYSVVRSMKAIERSDVVLLMLDATTGITEQDQHIAGYVMEAGRSIVLIVNKWDAIEKDSYTHTEFMKRIREKFDFLPDPPVIFISALTGQRIHEVLQTAHDVWENRHFRISTGELNRLLREALAQHAPPVRGGKRLKIYFGAQVAVDPPVLLFHVNDVRLVHFTFKRYLENRIREAYPFPGTPLRMSFRPRDGGLGT